MVYHSLNSDSKFTQRSDPKPVPRRDSTSSSATYVTVQGDFIDNKSSLDGRLASHAHPQSSLLADESAVCQPSGSNLSFRGPSSADIDTQQPTRKDPMFYSVPQHETDVQATIQKRTESILRGLCVRPRQAWEVLSGVTMGTCTVAREACTYELWKHTLPITGRLSVQVWNVLPLMVCSLCGSIVYFGTCCCRCCPC